MGEDGKDTLRASIKLNGRVSYLGHKGEVSVKGTIVVDGLGLINYLKWVWNAKSQINLLGVLDLEPSTSLTTPPLVSMIEIRCTDLFVVYQ